MKQQWRWTRFMSGCFGLLLVALAVGTSDDVWPEFHATPTEVGLAAAAASQIVLRFGDRRRGT